MRARFDAEAVVRSTAAEADVLVRVARDVEGERVVEDVFVTVRGDVPDADLVAGLELPARASSVSLVTLRRKYMTGDAQRTISSVARLRERRVVDEQLVLLGVVAERADAVRDRVARRLVAGDGEQQEEEVEVHLR